MDSEKSEMNALERFLIWFLVPVVFGIVLLTVLFYLLDVNIKQDLIGLGNRIPIVRNWVPDDPALDVSLEDKPGETKAPAPASDESAAKLKEKDAEIKALQAKLTEQAGDVDQYQSSFLKKDQELKDLQANYDKLEQDYRKMEQNDETYQKSVSETSKLYAEMSPSKAAPIIQKLTLPEQVLVLAGMKLDAQTKILEKMDTQAAADVSILLKDEVPARDRTIAALQERIKKLTSTTAPTTATAFTVSDLGTSVAGMAPKQAADLLLEMYKTNQPKVIAILKATDSQSRANILGALTTADKTKAAAISSRLTP